MKISFPRYTLTSLLFKRCPVVILFLLLSFSVSLSAPSKALANKKLTPVTLQLKWFHQFQFAGYYAALEKGFYEDEGLDVTILERDLKFNPVDQVLQGRADFGVSNSEILLHYLSGKKVVLLASIFQHSPLVFVSKTTPLLHNPHDLVNKTVLMSTASQDIELRAMLKKVGVDLNQINLIDRFATPEDYFSSNIDVIAAYLTNQPYYLEKAKKPYSVIYPSTYGIDFYGDTLFTSKNLVSKHPERVRKFLRASLKGWKYALDNPAVLIKIITNKFGSLKTKEHLKYEADKVHKLVLPDLVKIGHINPTRWEQISLYFQKLGADVKQTDLSDFFFNPATGNLVVKEETVIYVTSLFIAILVILMFTLYVTNKLNNEVNYRRSIEEKLKNSEKYYRSLFKNTGTATIILNNEHLIEHCNENFVQLSGYNLEDIEGKIKWTRFVAPDELPRIHRYIQAKNDRRLTAPKAFDFKFLRKNGEIRNIHVYVEIVDETEDIVASLIDMTEKVKTQELLIQTEKMISVGGLAAGMAHEINNPLAGILQAAQNIKRRISPEIKTNSAIAENYQSSIKDIYGYLEERGIVRMLNGIQSSGERAALIVKNMLDFTRRNEEGCTGCNLNSLIDGIIEIISCDYDLRKKYDFKHTNIIKEYKQDLAVTSCYKIEIEQVLLNLIKNAAFAMYETSRIRSPELIIRTFEDDKYSIIEVEDNGPGMRKEVKRRIFEPFFTTKSPGLGTGLGLSVSFFIITQNHSGHFEVESEVGKGSKFIIKLPKQK